MCVYIYGIDTYVRCASNSECSSVFQCLQSDAEMSACVAMHEKLSNDDKNLFDSLSKCEEQVKIMMIYINSGELGKNQSVF